MGSTGGQVVNPWSKFIATYFGDTKRRASKFVAAIDGNGKWEIQDFPGDLGLVKCFVSFGQMGCFGETTHFPYTDCFNIPFVNE